MSYQTLASHNQITSLGHSSTLDFLRADATLNVNHYVSALSPDAQSHARMTSDTVPHGFISLTKAALQKEVAESLHVGGRQEAHSSELGAELEKLKQEKRQQVHLLRMQNASLRLDKQRLRHRLEELTSKID